MSWPSFSSCWNYKTTLNLWANMMSCLGTWPGVVISFFFFLKAFYFILGYTQLTIMVIVSGRPQRDSAPFSPELPSHPGCHLTLSRVPRVGFSATPYKSFETGTGRCSVFSVCTENGHSHWQLLFWLQRCVEMRSPELGLLLSQRFLACAPSTWMREKRKSHAAISTNL